ncbi:hypothetical protein SDC9_164828 [bioreactor metagenome]|uniref:Uncharacterized protein n=1 Tax=bioreactor metagenome TaxID=1076179 RepID=A0A645FSP2_9ZZZZ
MRQPFRCHGGRAVNINFRHILTGIGMPGTEYRCETQIERRAIPRQQPAVMHRTRLPLIGRQTGFCTEYRGEHR